MCGRARVSRKALDRGQVICNQLNSSRKPNSNRNQGPGHISHSNQQHLREESSTSNGRIVENLSPGMQCSILIFDIELDSYILYEGIWGLIPKYEKYVTPSDHYKLFNKRIEKLSSPYYSNLVKGSGKSLCHRCLVIVDGFYEWKSTIGSKAKQPYYIHSEHPLVLPAIWEHFSTPEKKDSISFAIITCDSSPLLSKEIHDRQPVMLSETQLLSWMDHTLPPSAVDNLLLEISKNASNEDFEVNKSISLYPVTLKMTNPKYQEADCSSKINHDQRIDSSFFSVLKDSKSSSKGSKREREEEKNQQSQGSTPSTKQRRTTIADFFKV